MYIPIGPSKKQLYKIIIALLLLCYLIFLGMYKPKALTYSVDVQMKNQIGLGSNFADTFEWNNTSPALSEIILDINKTITCDSDVCLASIPFTISYNHYLSTASSDDYEFVWNYLGMFAILWGASPNYSCSYSNGSLDCPITNGQELKKIEIFVGKVNDTQPWRIQYVRGAFINVYNVTNVGTAISGINNNTNDIKNNLNDSSIDNSSANNLTSNSAFQDSNGLDSIIKAPLNFIQSLTSSTCSAITLTIPYIDANVSLPCMSSVYNKALGVQLVNLIALVINGIVLYRYCLKILQIVKDAKNPNKDGLEVLDL